MGMGMNTSPLGFVRNQTKERTDTTVVCNKRQQKPTSWQNLADWDIFDKITIKLELGILYVEEFKGAICGNMWIDFA